MNLPLSREELDEQERYYSIHGTVRNCNISSFITQARLAIELKEALEWVFNKNISLYPPSQGIGFQVYYGVFLSLKGEGPTPLEAIQNARKKEEKL